MAHQRLGSSITWGWRRTCQMTPVTEWGRWSESAKLECDRYQTEIETETEKPHLETEGMERATVLMALGEEEATADWAARSLRTCRSEPGQGGRVKVGGVRVRMRGGRGAQDDRG